MMTLVALIGSSLVGSAQIPPPSTNPVPRPATPATWGQYEDLHARLRAQPVFGPLLSQAEASIAAEGLSLASLCRPVVNAAPDRPIPNSVTPMRVRAFYSGGIAHGLIRTFAIEVTYAQYVSADQRVRVSGVKVEDQGYSSITAPVPSDFDPCK